LGWGVSIAHWDRPDWYAEDCQEAKAVAEEIVVRPTFPREVQEADWLFDLD
jgi:hypothetical protein